MCKPRYSYFILTALLLLLASGCESKVKELPPEENADSLEAVSGALDVDIYLDATLSMKGFVVPGIASHYEQTIQLLERAVSRGWEGGKATFYRFGSTISPIKSRGYLEAAQPGFYTDKNFFQKTYIENVIDAARSDHLTVIVTDLFQNDADINLLTRKLKDKYLAKNLAIGILGIKSQFNGDVYDVGIRNYSFSYVSEMTKPETYRPFYVLMLGKHLDVTRYYDELEKSGLKNFPSNNFLIFSPFLEHPATTFEGGRIETPIKIVETSGIVSPTVKEKRIKQFKQFRLRDSSSTASLIAALAYTPLRYTMTFNPAAVDTEISAWKFTNPHLESNEEAKQAVKVNGINFTEGKMNVELTLNAMQLPAKSIHCFRVVLRPKEYRLPEGFSRWDMPLNLVEEWRRHPQSFNGATTYNLKPFLNDLWETLVQLHKPKIADFYFFVQNA
ncbi:MAG: hypothetical protein HY231_05910 [Acidobacteria bacterium]|nr:hypothetical protein [Acidobacteriota bacterium]